MRRPTPWHLHPFSRRGRQGVAGQPEDIQTHAATQDPHKTAVLTVVDGDAKGSKINTGHRPILAPLTENSQSTPNR
jgi:hypothetical protein